MTSLRTSLVFSASLLSTILAASGGCGDSSSDGGGGAGGQGGARGSADAYCSSDKNCRDDGRLCDKSASLCVECISKFDCDDGQLCSDAQCVTLTPCDNSRDCASDEVCSEDLGYCVNCAGDNDCEAGQVCLQNMCEESCTSDKDCAASDRLCDSATEICVECTADKDCSDSDYCRSGSCETQLCVPGEGFCDADRLVVCGDSGGGFEWYECGDTCVDDGDTVECEGGASEGGGGSSSGGSSSGGSSSGGSSGGSSGCSSASVDLCFSVPAFSGTQTVDGAPDEFCDVPTHTFSPANAPYLLVENEGVDRSVHEASVRAAWNSSGLYVHVHVKDPAVLHDGSASYDGDNVQLFVSGASPSAGDVGYDENGGSQQITVEPPDEFNPAGQVSASFSSSGQTFDGASRLVGDGYEAEFFFAWNDTVPSSSSTIGLNIQIGVQDAQATGGRDYEYAMALDAVAVSGCASYLNQPDAPWCDARHWCSPTVD